MLNTIRNVSSVVALMMAVGSPPLLMFVLVRVDLLLLRVGTGDGYFATASQLHWPESYFVIQAVVTAVALLTWLISGISTLVRRKSNRDRPK